MQLWCFLPLYTVHICVCINTVIITQCNFVIQGRAYVGRFGGLRTHAPTYLYKNMLSLKIKTVLKELETLNENVLSFGMPQEFAGHYIPRDKKFLWAVPRSTAEFLYELVKIHEPKSILELGTSGGYSTIWMAAAAFEYGGHVHTVERFAPKVDFAAGYILRSGLSHVVTHYTGDAAAVISAWNDEKEFDFVFMDANKKQYLNHLKLLEPHLQPGALVVADNIADHPDMVRDYVEYVTMADTYDSVMVEIDNGLLLSRAK